MDLTESQITRIEELLALLDVIDPADLPEPAAELASLLSSLLEETETS